jgi:hypothetical protein
MVINKGYLEKELKRLMTLTGVKQRAIDPSVVLSDIQAIGIFNYYLQGIMAKGPMMEQQLSEYKRELAEEAEELANLEEE